MKTLLVGDHDNKTLKEATAKALSCAVSLGGEVDVVIAGKGCRAVAEQAAQLSGVARVLLADADAYEHVLAEPFAALIVSLAAPYDAILAPSTSSGRNILPRVAALLDVMQISDVSRVLAPDTFERPIYAGNVIETVRTTDKKKVITVRTTAFPRAAGGGTAPVEPIPAVANPGTSQFESEELHASARAELTRARQSTPATPRTTGRWARRARSSRRICTLPRASPAPFSIWQASKTRRSLSRSTRIRMHRSLAWLTTAWLQICMRRFRKWRPSWPSPTPSPTQAAPEPYTLRSHPC